MGNFKEDIARTEAFIFDVDGVMTDGGIIPTLDGDFIRRYNAKDGYALGYAVKMGYKVCIITGGRGKTLENRLRMLGINRYYTDCMDKITAMREYFADEGIDLEIVQFSDYVTPNNALANGDIDLNAFQHRIYLQNEIDNYGYAIQNIGNTFIIPLNLYSQKVSSVDELKDGDIVAIPDDLTNGGRALKVLEAAGLIELDPNAAFNPTVDDITSYKVNITIEELKANTIPSVLPDVAAAVVNGNYALDFGLKTDEAIYKDSVLEWRSTGI